MHPPDTPADEPPADTPPADQSSLTPPQITFCLTFLANGGNRTRAYLVANPEANYQTARSEGARWAAKPNVAGFIDAKRAEYWDKLEMSAAEAIALIADDARADVRRLFNEKGRMLDPHEWPDDVARSIHSIQPSADGLAWKVKLNDPLAARRLVLELQGKLKGANDSGLRDLAEILAEKWSGEK